MEHQNDNGDFIDKKQFVLSMAVIMAICVILFLTIFLMLNNRITKLHETKPNEQQPVFNETASDETEADDEYVIKEFDGKIGVFKNGDFQYMIDVYVFTLPEYDKKLLSQGIKVSSEQELNDVLSSYY